MFERDLFIVYIGIPVLNVTYSAMWTFAEIVTSTCYNISSRLDDVKEVLEETLSRNCFLLKIKSTVMFTYSLFAFTVLIQNLTFALLTIYIYNLN